MKDALVRWENNRVSICPHFLLDYYKNIEIIRAADMKDYKNYAIHAEYKPLTILDTTHTNAVQNTKKWLEVRKMGLGGSDCAAARDRSKYKTKLELYNEKVFGIKENKIDWVTSAHGHILEPLIRDIFMRKTGYPVYKVERMLQHPFFPFLLADVDGICKLPDGKYAILEIKTTSPWNLTEWKDNSIPDAYMEQGRHYMAVLNLDTVFYICYFGNSSKDVIIRSLKRDFEKEETMIHDLEEFWYNHILKRVPPKASPEIKNGNSKKYKQYIPINTLDMEFIQVIEKYLEEKGKKKNANKETLLKLESQIVNKLNGFEAVTFKGNGSCYTISYKKEQPRRIMTKEKLELLQFQHPDIYEKYTTETYKHSILRIREGRL